MENKKLNKEQLNDFLEQFGLNYDKLFRIEGYDDLNKEFEDDEFIISNLDGSPINISDEFTNYLEKDSKK